MDAHKAIITNIFNNSTLIEVPFFQRSYVWKADLWARMIEDMEYIVKTNKPHFFGSIILKEGRRPHPGENFTDCRTIVDGQQRLTTFLLFMKVLCLKLGQSTTFDCQFRIMGQSIALRHGRNDIEAFERVMPPPWLAHREIERYSIGWRMGYGEDYIDRFGDWLDTLSPEERTEYRTLFPEPVTWKGWWDDEDSSEVLEHGDFLVDAWQPEGQPKYTRQWLHQEFAAGRKRELCLFWGHQPSEDGQLTKSCLSQWWMEDFYTTADSYLCMEQYMMAAKAELFGDKEIRDQILKCSDQKQIKALGRKVRGFDQKVWDKFKYAIVLLGNWHKFSQNRELREFLLSTGDSV